VTNPKVLIKYGSAVKGLMFDNASAAEGAEAPSSRKGSPRCTGAVIRDEPGAICTCGLPALGTLISVDASCHSDQ